MRNDLYLKSIGNRIREIRASKNLKQNELSKMCGICQCALSEIENGMRNSFVLTLKAIADKLNVELKELM